MTQNKIVQSYVQQNQSYIFSKAKKKYWRFWQERHKSRHTGVEDITFFFFMNLTCDSVCENVP